MLQSLHVLRHAAAALLSWAVGSDGEIDLIKFSALHLIVKPLTHNLEQSPSFFYPSAVDSLETRSLSWTVPSSGLVTSLLCDVS